MKRLIVLITPPVIIQIAKWIRDLFVRPEWEFIPSGWQAADFDKAIKGWEQQSVLDAYVASWPQFVRRLEGTQAFGFSPELITTNNDIVFHNVILSFAYALNIAATQNSKFSMLDWGGGIGHYYLISQKLRPDIDIEYHCKDLPLFAGYGNTLFPRQHFHANDEWRDYKYDLVLASSSLQYSKDWCRVLGDLAQVTRRFIFITRIPVIRNTPSFVFVQRPYAYHYNTEYLGWCLNRNEILSEASQNGLTLVREFITEIPPVIKNAPEQCEYLGFLFRKD